MAANNILLFGGLATTEMSQAAYVASSQRTNGNQPGIADPTLVNKAMHQMSLVAAGVAQYLADRQATALDDTLTVAQVAAMLTANLPNPTVGSVKNLRANLATAGASLTVTADEVVVKAALGAAGLTIPNFNKSINVSTTGVGGMDTGAVPATGWVAIYAIWNPTTGVSALLGVNATSITAPEVYGGANMPAGYTLSALVSIWPVTSSILRVAAQYDRDIYYYNGVGSGLSISTTYQALSMTAAVPRNAILWKGNLGMICTNAATFPGNYNAAVSASGLGAGTPGYAGWQMYNAANITISAHIPELQIFTPQTTYYASQMPASGTGTLVINCYGFRF